MSEVWKDIEGYEGLYQVSNLGRVKSTQYYHGTYERIMKPIDNKGYLKVQLFKDKKYKWHLVHRLVANEFIPNPSNLPCVNHRDECKTNNNINNLEWCDHKYNNTYGSRVERVSDKTTNGKCSKTVYQYSIDNEFIKKWQSVKEVCRQMEYSKGNISQCCNGKRKTANGFIWRYIKEPQSN